MENTNRATQLLRAALADVKVQIKSYDQKAIAEKAGCTTRTVRMYILEDRVLDQNTAKKILVAATEIIKSREAEAASLVQSYNLIKE